MVGLSKQPEGAPFDASKVVNALVPAYVDLLKTLKDMGVPEVQIHEPILTTHRADALKSNFQSSFAELSKAGLAIDLVTYYDDVGVTYPWVVQLPVEVRHKSLSLPDKVSRTAKNKVILISTIHKQV